MLPQKHPAHAPKAVALAGGTQHKWQTPRPAATRTRRRANCETLTMPAQLHPGGACIPTVPARRSRAVGVGQELLTEAPRAACHPGKAAAVHGPRAPARLLPHLSTACLAPADFPPQDPQRRRLQPLWQPSPRCFCSRSSCLSEPRPKPSRGRGLFGLHKGR